MSEAPSAKRIEPCSECGKLIPVKPPVCFQCRRIVESQPCQGCGEPMVATESERSFMFLDRWLFWPFGPATEFRLCSQCNYDVRAKWKSSPWRKRLTFASARFVFWLSVFAALGSGMIFLESLWNFLRYSVSNFLGEHVGVLFVLAVSSFIYRFAWGFAQHVKFGQINKTAPTHSPSPPTKRVAKLPQGIPLPPGVEAKRGYWRLYTFLPDVGIQHVYDLRLAWVKQHGDRFADDVTDCEEPQLLIDENGQVIAHSATWTAYVPPK